MLSQVVINQGNFALQNRAENVVQTVVHCFSIISTNKLKINKITPLSQGPLGSLQGHNPNTTEPPNREALIVYISLISSS